MSLNTESLFEGGIEERGTEEFREVDGGKVHFIRVGLGFEGENFVEEGVLLIGQVNVRDEPEECWHCVGLRQQR